jgi:hypothetical protein
MNHSRMQRLTGVFALASVVLWISIFPPYMASDPSGSLYDGAAIIANIPPLLWFPVVGILMIRKRQSVARTTHKD